MTDKTQTFTQAEELRRACLEQNKRVERWLAVNWQRVGLESAVDKATISRALSGRPVRAEIVDALDTMIAEIYDDPWAWLEPPNDPSRFSQYAPLDWWYSTLDLHEDQIPRSIFKRIQTRPLSDDQYRILDRHWRDWVGRLQAACDAFKRDRELVRAVEADLNPEYQTVAGKSGRVGNPGMIGKSLDEVAMALALTNIDMTLPDIERACSTYQRPDPITVDSWVSEPVVAFAGDEVEGFEWRDIIRKDRDPFKRLEPPVEPPARESHWRVRHRWDGSRYQVEDVLPFAQVLQDGKWRDTTPEERERWITGLDRKQTRADLMAQKDEWIDDVWESRRTNTNWQDRLKWPDGIPREAIEQQFDVMLSRIDDEAARENNADLERRLMKFNLTLRRRPARS